MDKIDKMVIIVVIGSTALAAVLFVVSYTWYDAVFQKILGITFQFFLIVVLGGAVAWLFREYTRQREIKDQHKNELMELRRDLVNAYNRIKCIRRLLRARAQRGGKIRDPNTVIRRSVYEELMGELNEIQLRLEGYKRRVRGEEQIFRSDGVSFDLENSLDKMEKYLNDIISEYETALRPFEEDPDYLSASKLEKLREFIAPRMDEKDIRENIYVAFRQALEALARY
jgi:hypothetical protein